MADSESPDRNDEAVFKGLRQLIRYSCVGLLNTAIDFTLTNTLVIFTGATGAASLFLISLTACLIATLVSYPLNRLWTFGLAGKTLPRSTGLKYFGVAFLAMMVNTSVFLFVYQFLTDQMSIERLFAINIAKLFGVATAAIVAFLGYRISVFRPAAIESFRNEFRFAQRSLGFSLRNQILSLIAVAAVARFSYLLLTTAVFGDAAVYGWIAQAISQGDWAHASSGWFNPFCYWESLFYLVGFSPVQSAIGASIVPGILLVVPVAWVARRFYGEKVAWLVGWLTALHPRLIGHSCNGLPETFYLLALATGVAIVSIAGWRQITYALLATAGVCLGVYFCVRNEGLILILVLLIGLWFIARRARQNQRAEIAVSWSKHFYKSTEAVLLGFSVLVVAYTTTSQELLHESGLFKKTSVFTQKYSEQLDPMSSAREVYGYEGRYAKGYREQADISEQLWTWAKRFPSNVLHTLKSIPGVFLTPMWFFAFMFPLFVRSVNGTFLPEWPWVLLLAFPFVVYPLLYVESRFLFSAILSVHLFGAAGLVALSAFIGRSGYATYFYPTTVGIIVFMCIAISVWRGNQVESGYAFHRDLASWIEQNVPPNDKIVGDGYGFVSTTGFLAHRPTINRIIHYDPFKVVEFVREQGAQWLVLYEPFIMKVNPELHPYMNIGLPGMKRVYQITDNYKRRVQVYHLEKNASLELQKPIFNK
ncbi:MAG: GtrA family protein [Chlamydiales bacterium]|nr:GtrA family protein [Chlamydiales bacterium]